MLDGDSSFLGSEFHLANLQALDENIRVYENWEIVGIRIDPCINSFPSSINTKEDILSCKKEFRLVAQPFFTADDNRIALDASFHLIYDIEDIESLINDLKQLAQVGREVESNLETWNVLGLHPALKNEAGNCNGVYTNNLRNLAKKYAPSSSLKQVAWMTSSGLLEQWTFGALRFTNGSFTDIQIPGGGTFDNFSSIELDSGRFPMNRSIRSISISNTTFGQSVSEYIARTTDRSLQDSAMDDMVNALNPNHILQVSGSCIQCHSAPQFGTIMANRFGRVQPQFLLSGAEVETDSRAMVHFRNFGYSPGFKVTVSPRTANESIEVARLINSFFP